MKFIDKPSLFKVALFAILFFLAWEVVLIVFLFYPSVIDRNLCIFGSVFFAVSIILLLCTIYFAISFIVINESTISKHNILGFKTFQCNTTDLVCIKSIRERFYTTYIFVYKEDLTSSFNKAERFKSYIAIEKRKKITDFIQKLNIEIIQIQ